MKNSIIDDVRAARAALAEEHGYDREKILEWARRQQAKLKSKASVKPQSVMSGNAPDEAEKIPDEVSASLKYHCPRNPIQ